MMNSNDMLLVLSSKGGGSKKKKGKEKKVGYYKIPMNMHLEYSLAHTVANKQLSGARLISLQFSTIRTMY